MERTPKTSQEFSILIPEAAQRHAASLLNQALSKVRGATEACLRDVPETGRMLARPVMVGGTVFRIPLTPNVTALRSLNEELQAIFGSIRLHGLKRADIDTAAIRQHPELFAALYAWGYLWPENEWGDVIQWVREPPCTGGEADRRDILQVFTGFAHGAEGSGIHFRSGDRRLCFDSAYQGRAARVMSDCMEVGPQELCDLDRMEIVSALLQHYPELSGQFQDVSAVLEAMVEVVQKGEGAA